MPAVLSKGKSAEVIGLRRQGYSYRAAAELAHVSKTSVGNAIRRWNEEQLLQATELFTSTSASSWAIATALPRLRRQDRQHEHEPRWRARWLPRGAKTTAMPASMPAPMPAWMSAQMLESMPVFMMASGLACARPMSGIRAGIGCRQPSWLPASQGRHPSHLPKPARNATRRLLMLH